MQTNRERAEEAGHAARMAVRREWDANTPIGRDGAPRYDPDYKARQHAAEMAAFDRAYDKQEPDTCLYCGRDIPIDAGPVPAVDDHDAWAILAGAHAPDCDWIRTRAHRINTGYEGR